MFRVELHCHTIYSRDCLLRPEALLEACTRKGIQRVAVTDHNTIAGALAANALDPQRVIVGEEILTSKGELLAYFVQEEIPCGLEPVETIERLRDQGAFISAAHPFDVSRKGHWNTEDLLAILPLVDAIEGFNARSMAPIYNRQAEEFAREYGILTTVGSDAHTAFELGRASLYMPPFNDAESMRVSLGKAEQHVKWSPPWVHLSSRYAVWKKSMDGGLGGNRGK